MSATCGYLDLSAWETVMVIDQPSKPVVAANLLRGRFDAGLAHVHHADEHPGELRLVEPYGAVNTIWLVYGPFKRSRGAVIGQRPPWLFDERARASQAAPAPSA